MTIKIWDYFLSSQSLSTTEVKNTSEASGIAESGFEQEIELIFQGCLTCVLRFWGIGNRLTGGWS